MSRVSDDDEVHMMSAIGCWCGRRRYQMCHSARRHATCTQSDVRVCSDAMGPSPICFVVGKSKTKKGYKVTKTLLIN